jgi:hypothetical protein
MAPAPCKPEVEPLRTGIEPDATTPSRAGEQATEIRPANHCVKKNNKTEGVRTPALDPDAAVTRLRRASETRAARMGNGLVAIGDVIAGKKR